MSTRETSNEMRAQAARKIDLATGGIVDGGCIKQPDIIAFNPLPLSTPPWSGPAWVRVGRTGML